MPSFEGVTERRLGGKITLKNVFTFLLDNTSLKHFPGSKLRWFLLVGTMERYRNGIVPVLFV